MEFNNHFANYYHEEHGEEVIANEKGFITYRIYPESKEIMVGEFFVKPEHRGGPAAYRLAEEVKRRGEKEGCKIMTCRVALFSQDPAYMERKSRLLSGHLRYGFRLGAVNHNEIFLIKDIGDDNE